MNDQSDIIWKLLETQRSLITELQSSYERERALLTEINARRAARPAAGGSSLRRAARKAKRAVRQPRHATTVLLRKSRNGIARTLPLLRGSK
ncbi:MAG: hypothetical protein ABWX68_06675 [Arthrobacter sp.]|uniref:hypothetical protein n=1 Tax=Arthrobacter sp. TaxID=1667 RepID=UPI00349A754C